MSHEVNPTQRIEISLEDIASAASKEVAAIQALHEAAILEATARQALQEAATLEAPARQALQEVTTLNEQSAIVAGFDITDADSQFGPSQHALEALETRGNEDLHYAETMPVDESPETTEADLAAQAELIADIQRSSPSRRQLIEGRLAALDAGDVLAAYVYHAAVIEKFGLGDKTTLEQRIAIKKLERLYRVAGRITSPTDPTPNPDEEKATTVTEEAAPSETTDTNQSADSIEGPTAEYPILKVVREGDTANDASEAPVTRSSEQFKHHHLSVGSDQEVLHRSDRMVQWGEQNLYAVVDGIGEHERGGEAAEILRRTLVRYWEKVNEPMTKLYGVTRMREAFSYVGTEFLASAAAGTISKDMGAVMTAVKFFETPEGELHAIVGHVGDTRLYLQSSAGESIKQLTQDEGANHRVRNAFQAGIKPKLEQFFITPVLEPGARLMLCSDGIPGDAPENLLSQVKLEEAFKEEHEQEVANKLRKLNSKPDDKSVIVIDVEVLRNQTESAVEGSTESAAEPSEFLAALEAPADVTDATQ